MVVDNGALREALLHVLSDLEYVERAEAGGSPDPLARASSGRFDAVVADVSGGGPSALRTVSRIMKACPDLPMILAQDDRTPRTFGEEVFEYLRAPVAADALRRAVFNAVEKHRLQEENRMLLQRLNKNGHAPRDMAPAQEVAAMLIGESAGMRQIRNLIAEVAHTDITVLITGESGTGKEVVARAIHATSPRSKKGAMVKINCPAVPELLLESELFGHEAGAFTGAGERKPGRLELTPGGTAFLDEVAEIPLAVQAKLLQVLEHKQFTRLGGTHTLSLDIRFLAATNMPLIEQISARKFRKDLYFRLNQYAIHIPPLRERVEDIPLLANHFLAKFGPMYGRGNLTLSDQAMARLIRHVWPGNVRELESVIQCFALTGREESINDRLSGNPGGGLPPAGGTHQQCEKQLIMSTLVEVKWNRRRAAEILGISYNTLRRRIAQYCLDNERPEWPYGAARMTMGAGDFQ